MYDTLKDKRLLLFFFAIQGKKKNHNHKVFKKKNKKEQLKYVTDDKDCRGFMYPYTPFWEDLA